MAITVPTEYAKWQGRSGEMNGTIIVLTTAGSRLLFSDFDIGNKWTDETVWPLITKKISIRQKIDPIEHNPSRAVVNLTLSNTEHYSGRTRVSDSLDDVVAHGAAVYHLNSPNATTLTDCLQIFSGSTQEVRAANNKSVSVKLEDRGHIFDQIVLNRKISDVIGSGYTAFDNNKDRLMPVLYGNWDETNGLAKAWRMTRTNAKSPFTFCPADHPVGYSNSGPDKLYVSLGSDVPAMEMEVPVQSDGSTKYAEKKRPDGASSPGIHFIWAMLTPTGGYKASKRFLCHTNFEAPFDESRYQHSGIDNVPYEFLEQTGNSTNSPAQFDNWTDIEWNNGDQYTHYSNMALEIVDADKLQAIVEAGSGATQLYCMALDWYINPALNARTLGTPNIYNSGELYRSFIDRSISIRDGYFIDWEGEEHHHFLFHADKNGGGGVWVSPNGHSGGFKELAFDMNASSGKDAGGSRKYALQMRTIVGPVTDTNPEYIANISGVYLNVVWESRDLTVWNALVRYTELNPFINSKKWIEKNPMPKHDIGNGQGLDSDFAFVKTGGRPYNTRHEPYEGWYSNFTSGVYGQQPIASTYVTHRKVIDEAAAIIANVLIMEGGVKPADLDWDGFVNSIVYAIRCRVQILNEDATFGDVIQQLCDQGMFTYAWSAAGQMKLIPLRTMGHPAQPIAATILYGDLDSKGIKLSKSNVDEVVNHITVNSRWEEDVQAFKDVDVYENTTSQAKYGVRKKEVDFPNINTGDEAAIVTNPVKALMVHLIEPDKVNGVTDSNHLVDDGYWANQRNQIDFTSLGSKHKHLDIGDWIIMDSTTTDPHIKMFGSSWSNQKFLITDIKKDNSGTKISAERIAANRSLWDMRSIGIILP